MKQVQRLQSARSWLETYAGNNVVKAYRKRYGVDFATAFRELEMLDVAIDPDYQERVLQSIASQVAAKRQKRARERIRQVDVWAAYEDDEAALARAGDCTSCELFRPLDELGLCPVCAAMLERDLIRQRDWDYTAATSFLAAEDREALRQQVVAEYGKELELITPSASTKRHYKKG